MTVWLHITASYFWTQRPVGVIRVERELFCSLSQKVKEPVRYCVFVGGELYEVEPKSAVVTAAKEKKRSQFSFFRLIKGALWAGAKAAFFHILREDTAMQPTLEFIYKLRRKISHLRPLRLSLPLAEISADDTFVSVSIDAGLDYVSLFDAIKFKHRAHFIGFCHDILPVTHPELCAGGATRHMESYFEALIKASSIILCNSKCTLTDINTFIAVRSLNQPLLRVMPLGCNLPVIDRLSELEANLIPEGDFVLYVSTVERRKNHRILYDVYAQLVDDPRFSSLPTLCFVGSFGWRVNDLLEDIRLNERVASKFVFLTDVSDSLLAELYRRALFCVFPSHYEGWGLPVSEALALGKAVIASDAGALTEASGGCALHLSPFDTSAWRDAILRMSNDHAWRAEWESRAVHHFHPHSWEEAAEIVEEAIEAVKSLQEQNQASGRLA